MTIVEKVLEAEESDEPIGMVGASEIGPIAFLKLEADLFTTITPAWRDAQIAAREAAPEPPGKRHTTQTIKRYAKVNEATARRVLVLLLRKYQPGDTVRCRQVQEVTQYSETHSLGAIHKLKQLKLWPFAPPPFKRAESQPKESQHDSRGRRPDLRDNP